MNTLSCTCNPTPSQKCECSVCNGEITYDEHLSNLKKIADNYGIVVLKGANFTHSVGAWMHGLPEIFCTVPGFGYLLTMEIFHHWKLYGYETPNNLKEFMKNRGTSDYSIKVLELDVPDVIQATASIIGDFYSKFSNSTSDSSELKIVQIVIPDKQNVYPSALNYNGINQPYISKILRDSPSESSLTH
ncbi:hypothetical protein [Photobacterium kishitanii]|uniref:DUF4262 domain-containing protein n=1 Tax=Photobacterium kishitanii TaxID=318456 RepID=A0A2T3KLL6_9GAMM|nr:hypothetical protein [Photobacterium kishitanii]PSV00559.1 hypothetical protein C9J27_05335 [Photobacterium kishitanii]